MSELSDLPDLLPLDGDALALLRGGSELVQMKDDGRARLSGRVMSTIAAFGPPGGGGGSSGPTGNATGAVASNVKAGLGLNATSLVGMGLTFVLGAALGFGVRPLVGSDENVQSASIRPAATPEQRSAPRTLQPAEPAASSVVFEASTPTPSAASGGKVGPLRDLSAERMLLDGARAALGRGDPAAAVVAAKAHEQRFPRGALAEEREALYIQALAQSGKLPEARARAARFKQTYPDSMLLPAVSAATQAPSAPNNKDAP